MKRKYILMFMYVLTSICIFSIGFSSWTICMGDTITAQGNFLAEDVFLSNEFIYINNQSNVSLKYYETGFIDENNNITTKGSMSVDYCIDVTKCKSLYDDSVENLRVVITLDSLNFNIYKYTTLEIVVTDNQGNLIIPTNSINGETCSFSFILDGVLSDDNQNSISTFNVTYYFNVQSNDYFNKNIYPKIGMLTFSTHALINGE